MTETPNALFVNLEIMKRNIRIALIASIITFTILLYSCTTDKQETGWSEYNLKGKVKSFTEISYEAIDRFGKIELGDKRVDFEFILHNNAEYLFDNNGNKIEESLYFDDGSLRYKVIYKYDNNGNKIEENLYFDDGNLDTKLINLYDNKGNMIEANVYTPYGSLEDKYTFKYDEMRNRIEEKQYCSDDRLRIKRTYKYDNKGNMIEEKWQDFDSFKTKKYVYKYDNKGNIIEKYRYASDGSLDRKSSYKYDNNGNMIKMKDSYHNDNAMLENKYTFEYYYDEQGNWTRRIQFENSIPKYILVREIKYFD